MKSSKKGFTLIETLFALFTIGMVASFILPTLVKNNDETLLITKLQKTHTELEILYKSAAEKHGNPEYWDESLKSDELPIDYFYENTDVTKRCEPSKRCPSTKNYLSLDGSSYGRLFMADENQGCVVRADGSYVCIKSFKNVCTQEEETIKEICGTIFVDLNGADQPNVFGIDTFLFYYTKGRIIPSGAERYNLVMNCNKNYRYKKNGLSCTTWALEEGNMKYLEERIF